MTEPGQSQKQSLECLRLESACKELADSVSNPALRNHFVRMAQVWDGLAHETLDELAAVSPAGKICAA